LGLCQKYGLPIKLSIQNTEQTLRLETMADACVEDGITANSGQFTGLPSDQARARMTTYAEEKSSGALL